MFARKPTAPPSLTETAEPVATESSVLASPAQEPRAKKTGRSTQASNATKAPRKKTAMLANTATEALTDSLTSEPPRQALPLPPSPLPLPLPAYSAKVSGLAVMPIPPVPLHAVPSLKPLATLASTARACPYRLKWNEQAWQLEVASDDAGFVSYAMQVLQHPLLPPVLPPVVQPVTLNDTPALPEPRPLSSSPAQASIAIATQPLEAKPAMPEVAETLPPPSMFSFPAKLASPTPPTPSTPPTTPSTPSTPSTLAIVESPPVHALVTSLLDAFEEEEAQTEALLPAQHASDASPSSSPPPVTSPSQASSEAPAVATPQHLESIWQQTLARFATLEGSLRFLHTGRSASKIEVLVVTAWHCTQQQQPPKPCFTLRELQQALGSLATENPSTTLGYRDVEQALEQGLLAVLPDVTGLAITTDYTLTSTGETLVQALLS
ncbi:MAG: hypothetical protein ACKO34_07675 [Vampirovibrionales bacterium]